VPSKDIYHDTVRHALTEDGWKITHDPFSLKVGKKDLFIDLGLEKFLAAEKLEKKIAVEIKSFVGASEVEDLRNAIGQYILYQSVLEKLEPERELFLAIRQRSYIEVFQEEIGQLLLEKKLIKLIVFAPKKKVIIKWIS
jgi:hypothetical protein